MWCLRRERRHAIRSVKWTSGNSFISLWRETAGAALRIFHPPEEKQRTLVVLFFHVVQFCSALIDRCGGGSTESACSSSPSPPASSVSHRYVNVFKTRGRPIRRNRSRSHRLVYCAGGFCSGSAASPSFGRSVSHGMCYPTHTRVCVFESSELHVCLPGRPSGECESPCVMGLFLNYWNISSPKGLVHHVA